MAKPKAFAKHGKGIPNNKDSGKKKKAEPKLESADDFQAAGVEFEEAAGKWRAGDAAKSLRFFARAVDVYDRGLARWPESRDLAYNKARVQLEMCTHPALVAELEESSEQQPLRKAIEGALASHRHALALEPENADVLFNTAQVLTTLAEDLVNADDDDDDGDELVGIAVFSEKRAVEALKEALALQSKCLGIQERRFGEWSDEAREEGEGDGERGEEPAEGGAGEAGPSQPVASSGAADEQKGHKHDDEASEEQWVSIEEPVDRDTLIDTVLAQLGTLTTLCLILSASPSLSSYTSSASTSSSDTGIFPLLEERSSELVQKLDALVATADDTKDASSTPVERRREIALAKANLVAAALEARFRAGRLGGGGGGGGDDDPAVYYRRERDAAFAPVAALGGSLEGGLADARALTAYATALGEVLEREEHGERAEMSMETAFMRVKLSREVDLEKEEKEKKQIEILKEMEDAWKEKEAGCKAKAARYDGLRYSALTAALAPLAAASKAPGADAADVAGTHMERGDASLRLHVLDLEMAKKGTAISAPGKNARNAEVYYRNAEKLGRGEAKRVAGLRGQLAAALREKAAAAAADEGPGVEMSEGEELLITGTLSEMGSGWRRGMSDGEAERKRSWAEGQVGEMANTGLLPMGFY